MRIVFNHVEQIEDGYFMGQTGISQLTLGEEDEILYHYCTLGGERSTNVTHKLKELVKYEASENRQWLLCPASRTLIIGNV